MRDELLLYYERELTYLREMGAQFAEKYPKIAARLMLEESKESEDPHVEVSKFGRQGRFQRGRGLDATAEWNHPHLRREGRSELRDLYDLCRRMGFGWQHNRRSAFAVALRLHQLRPEWFAVLLPAWRGRSRDPAS